MDFGCRHPRFWLKKGVLASKILTYPKIGYMGDGSTFSALRLWVVVGDLCFLRMEACWCFFVYYVFRAIFLLLKLTPLYCVELGMKMTPKSLHEAAMGYTFSAVMASDDPVVRFPALLRALSLEICAATLLVDRLDCEPTRAILFRSAATLAMRCGEWGCAIELADIGLSGNPPHDEVEYLENLACDALGGDGSPYGYRPCNQGGPVA